MARTHYYRDITIQNNEPIDLIDYQICIEIADADFFLKADPDNLILKDEDDILPYWIETWKRPDGKARIWTKVNLPASGSKTIKLCYGGFISWIQQNGDNVFEFFDDFDYNSSIPDVNKWIFSGNVDATYTCSNSVLTMHISPTSDSNYYGWIRSNIAIQQDINFFATMKVTNLYSPSFQGADTGVELVTVYTNSNDDLLFMYNKVTESLYSSDGHINNNWDFIPYVTHARMSAEPMPVIKDVNRVIEACYRNSYYDNTVNTLFNSYNYTNIYENRQIQIGLYHPATNSNATAKIDWIYIARLVENPPSITISSEIEKTYYWFRSPTKTLFGRACDKNGEAIVNAPVDIIVLNKDTKEVENVTTSNATDGSWQIETEPGKKLIIFALEGSYNEDADLAGADFLQIE